jgi:hypothetical protein
MIYMIDDAQLLALWTAISFLWEACEIEYPIAHDEILIRAQILLTVFVVGLEPRICTSDQLGLTESRSTPGDEI